MNRPKIGIRPDIDGRWGGVRESLENQTMNMAKSAAKLIEENLYYQDGANAECVIGCTTIGGGAEAAKVAEQFGKENVVATLSVTPCWCYGSETMDLDPKTIKAVWGFNGTERPGAVYLAAAMAAHAQRGLPAFSIYGHDVCDADNTEIPSDAAEKILRFARCALAVGQMKNKAYVNIGGVAMGIAGSFCAVSRLKFTTAASTKKRFRGLRQTAKRDLTKTKAKTFPKSSKNQRLFLPAKTGSLSQNSQLLCAIFSLEIPSLKKWAGARKASAETA